MSEVDSKVAEIKEEETANGKEVVNKKEEPAEKTQDETEKSNGATIPNDTVDEVAPETMKKIVKQLEYYFGDYNLPRDRFLRTQAELDEGWVPLVVMLKFARLNHLTKNPEVIVKSIEEIKSELLEVSQNKKNIRRVLSKPWSVCDETMQLATMERTTYCKNFPEESDLDDLVEFFEKFGKIEAVQKRQYREKNPTRMKFKGSVFVVFCKLEDAEAFMKLESVKYKDVELIRKWQKDYNEEKKLEREQKFNKGKKNKAEKNEGEKVEDDNIKIPKNCFLHLSEISGEVTREDLKAALQEKVQLQVAYVEFRKGDNEAWIRLQGNDSSTKAVELLGEEKKLEVCGIQVTVKALTEEEEVPHRERALKSMASKNFRRPRGRGKRRGGFGGGRGRSAKRAKTGDD